MKFKFRRSAFSLGWVVLLFVLGLKFADAQGVTGTITGTVTDSSGAAITDAKVTITNTDTKQVVRVTKTNSQGVFNAPSLQIGHYKLSAESPGFERTDIVDIVLNVSDTLSFNPKLQLGRVDASVTVTASDITPNLETQEVSSLINDVQMRELALNTRNFEQMVLLQPGASNQGPDESFPGLINATGAANVTNLSLNGLRSNQISWTLDGGDILNPVGLQQVAVFPSIDSITQIKVLRNSYGAQYGGAGSAQVTVVTKSGGSTIHGDVYEFFRTQYLDANDFQNLISTPQQPRAAENYNNFGYTLGGPIFIPKLVSAARLKSFFFVEQEFRRILQDAPIEISNFPSIAQANGYFAYQVTGSSAVTNSPYPGYNYQIPQSSFNTVSQEYLKDVIIPSVTLQPLNNPLDVQGIYYDGSSTTHENQISGRIDHAVNSRLNMFGRVLWDPYHLQVPYGLYLTTGYPGVGQAHVDSFGENIELHGTYVVTSTTVADFGYSYVLFGVDGHPNGFVSSSSSPDVSVSLPYVSTLARIPSITINGGSWTSGGPRHTRGHIQQFFENTTKQVGRHTIFFGGNFEHTHVLDDVGGNNAGTFTFTGAASGSVTAFAQSFANFLIGKVNTFTQASVDATSNISNNVLEFYVQDQWRATPRLTLNAGVRYSIYGQPYDGTNRLGGLDPAMFNPAQEPTFVSSGSTVGTMCITGVINTACTVAPNPNYNPLNGIINGGVNSPYGRALSTQPLLNFAPRAGFAWNVFGTGLTSLRGGYGIFYNRQPESLATSELNGNPAYVLNSTFNNVTFQQPSGASPAATTVPSITGQQPQITTPYSQDYNLDLQQTLRKSWIFDIGYVGNSTMHLAGEEDLNQLPSGYAASLGGALATFRPTSAATEAMINYLRPYPGYGAMEFFSNRFFADYHGLQVSTTRTFGTRNLFNLNYTWSKALANSQNTSGFAPQDRFNIAPDLGPTAADRRHIFTANIVYELPFFTHQRGFAGKILGGWETSMIVQMVSGLPLDIAGTSTDSGGQGNLASGSDAEVRPDEIADPSTGPRTKAQFFNKAAFALVPTGQYRQGDAHHNPVEGPGYQTWNITAMRNFALPREMRLQFRLEGFNAFNHVNFMNVGASFNNSTNFDTVTGYREMRKVQLAAKLYF